MQNTLYGQKFRGSPPRAWRHSLEICAGGRNVRFTSTRVETLTANLTLVPGQTVHLHARGDTEGDRAPSA